MAVRFYLIYPVYVCVWFEDCWSSIRDNGKRHRIYINIKCCVCVVAYVYVVNWNTVFTLFFWLFGAMWLSIVVVALLVNHHWWWPNLSLWMSAWVSINVRYFAYSWESQHTNWFRRFFALSLAKHLRQHSLGSVLTFPVPIWSFKMHVIAETFH